MKKQYVRPEVETVRTEPSDMLCVSGFIDHENEANRPGYAREIEADEWW